MRLQFVCGAVEASEHGPASDRRQHGLRDHVAVIKPLDRIPRLRSSAEWRFLAVLSRAAPGLAALWWALTVVRGALPAVFTIAIGVLVGEERPLAGTLLIVGGAFIAINILGPIHEAIAADLGARTAAWLNDDLMHSSSQRAYARPIDLTAALVERTVTTTNRYAVS